MRKTRSDAVLLNLPEAQQAKLAEWLLNGMPYHEATVLVEKEFGVSLKSLAPFASFWREVCQPAMLARRRRTASGAEARVEEAQKHPARFDRATIDALEQKALELAERPDPPAKDVKAVMMLLLKARDQDFKREKLAFDKERFQWDAATACLSKLPELKAISNDKSLSTEQRVEQIRLKLFGTLPEKAE